MFSAISRLGLRSVANTLTSSLRQSRSIHVLSNNLTRPILPNLTSPLQSPVSAAPTPSPGPGSLSGWIQTRGAKRDTYNPSQITRKRRHGFLARTRSRTGRKMLARRRAKGRTMISH